MKWLKESRRNILTGVLVATLLWTLGLQVTDRSNVLPEQVHFGIGNEKVITLGPQALYAAGSVDYTFDGVDDNEQFQAALDALPATGGRLVVVSAVQINFAVGMAATGVTRPIDNVTIEGAGAGTYFVRNATNYLFTAGGDGWHFSDLRTDAGGINMGATTGGLWTNLTIGTQLYTYYAPTIGIGAVFDLRSITANVTTLNAPTGRTATCIVAASDSPAHIKAQADYVADGTADNIEIQAALDALPATGGSIYLADGTYTVNVSSIILNKVNTQLWGSRSAIIRLTDSQIQGNVLQITASNNVVDGITIDGNYAGQSENWTGYTGIEVSSSNNTVIQNTTVMNVGFDAIVINTSDRVRVVDNLIRDSGEGVLFQNSNYGQAADNSFYSIGTRDNTLNDGLEVSMGAFALFTNNVFSDISGSAIDIYKSSFSTATGNIINSAGLSNQTAIAVQGSGVVSSDGNTVNDNVIIGSIGPAISVQIARYTVVSGNNINGGTQGIITWSPGNTILGNYIMTTTTGIDLENINNVVKGNVIGGVGTYRIREVGAADYNVITNNILLVGATPLVVVGANTIVRSNIGYITENSGTATMLINTDAISVATGMSAEALRVVVTMTSNPGLAISTWTDTYASGNFTIHTSSNVTAATTFDWRAVAREGN